MMAKEDPLNFLFSFCKRLHRGVTTSQTQACAPQSYTHEGTGLIDNCIHVRISNDRDSTSQSRHIDLVFGQDSFMSYY